MIEIAHRRMIGIAILIAVGPGCTIEIERSRVLASPAVQIRNVVVQHRYHQRESMSEAGCARAPIRANCVVKGVEARLAHGDVGERQCEMPGPLKPTTR